MFFAFGFTLKVILNKIYSFDKMQSLKFVDYYNLFVVLQQLKLLKGKLQKCFKFNLFNINKKINCYNIWTQNKVKKR